MADSTAIGLVTGTPAADTALVGQNTSAATRMSKFAYSALGGLVLASNTLTTANLTASVGTLHQLTIAGLTANRGFILPDTAAVGERVSLHVVDGDPSFEVEIKTAAAGSTINGTDCSTNEWSRVFIQNETLLFRCIVAGGAGATQWIVENDGRIPCHCEIADKSGTAGHYVNGTSTYPAFDTANVDVGGLADLASDDINIRRPNNYLVTVGGATPGSLGNGQNIQIVTRVNTAAYRRLSLYSPAASALLGGSISNLIPLVAGDGVSMTLYHTAGSNLTWSTGDVDVNTVSVKEVFG